MKQINHYFKSASPILHGVTRSYTELHGVTRSYTELHGVTRSLVLVIFLSFSFLNINLGQQNNSNNLWTSWQYNGNFPQSNLDCSTEDYKLVFYDEFDGTAIDTDTWFTFSPDGGPGFNGTDNCFWARGRSGGSFWGLLIDQNVEVNNGLLKLHVKKEPNVWFGVDFNYSAAMIWAKPQHEYLYGRFEARIKMHNGTGLWLVKNMSIDISHLSVGQYVLNIENEHNVSTHQIMIER